MITGRVLRNRRGAQHNKHPGIPLSPQARGSAGGRRRHDAASQEDHDKPYVCDSKYGRCPLPGPSPSSPCASLAVSPRLGLAGSSSWALTPARLPAASSPPSSPHLISSCPCCWLWGFLREGDTSPRGFPPGCQAPLCRALLRGFPLVLSLLKMHPLLLSLFQRGTNKSITQNPPTKVLGSCGFSFVSL